MATVQMTRVPVPESMSLVTLMLCSHGRPGSGTCCFVTEWKPDICGKQPRRYNFVVRADQPHPGDNESPLWFQAGFRPHHREWDDICGEHRKHDQDRKSTRLNSSH